MTFKKLFRANPRLLRCEDMDILNQQKIPNILEQFQKMYQNVSVCHKSQFGEIFSTYYPLEYQM